ncbi:MAG TPA: hydrogenase maturation nickel metallochaperone HypA [Candidatus Omnitrophica bacterium]|nr:MAG: hypothetical protein DRP61_02340 [Candidatus Omnitrophota bacterium]RKY35718.1 MAG: hypothetical protein DRP69_00455 [Candidatus Omnitrophota bacterium]RKY44591.1 MAG: hypothetical protein DRP80_01970 [Candidatus Omnitrophota bacterium]HEC69969.1 hydrogenase maturation nickel metallochaperone HypA [Candidatus Omnitrophota bacterium]
MHELTLAKDLWEVIKNKVDNLSKLRKIKIRVGKASGIDKEFLRHSFLDHIFPENGLNFLELELLDEDILLRCKSCKKDLTEVNSLNCPFCGLKDIQIVKGDKVYIESIEISSQ